jgi:hypothetical protein
MAPMAERRQAGVRVLRQHDVPPADATANVDVEQLLSAGPAEAGLKQAERDAALAAQVRFVTEKARERSTT